MERKKYIFFRKKFARACIYVKNILSLQPFTIKIKFQRAMKKTIKGIQKQSAGIHKLAASVLALLFFVPALEMAPATRGRTNSFILCAEIFFVS